MDTHNLKLSIFVYNKKMIQSLLQHIICSINDGHIQNSGITISKKWQKGPHIEVIIPGESFPDDKNAAFLRKAAEDFMGNNEIPQDESYEKYEKLSERVAILEGYKGSISPLNKHLEIVCEPFDWNSIDTIFPHDVYRDIEVTLSKFLFEAMPYYNSLSENDKMLFLTECMIILGNQREKHEELSGGIKYGYMTFQSHYQGFLAQLKGTPNEEMIKSVLTSDNRYVVDSLKSEMEELMRNEASAEHKNDKERILEIWRETVNHMLAKYEKSIEGNEISWNDSQNITGFFERNSNKLSSFHSHLKEKDNYMDFLGSVFFVKHRLAINEFYKQLPLFSVSPLKKHQLCKYVSEAVEEYFDQSYDDIIEKINFYYTQKKGTM